jgi:hypothetical protein
VDECKPLPPAPAKVVPGGYTRFRKTAQEEQAKEEEEESDSEVLTDWRNGDTTDVRCVGSVCVETMGARHAIAVLGTWRQWAETAGVKTVGG